jgi:uncharacterized protein (DUF433 family)
MKFERITVDPKRMDGVPCIRNLRIPVATVVGMIADGITEKEILKNYPDLEAADIREALHFASAELIGSLKGKIKIKGDILSTGVKSDAEC